MRPKLLPAFLLAAYTAIHIWWALAGAPHFDSFGESFIPGAWTPVAIASAALAANLLFLRSIRHDWAVVVFGWAAGIGMVLYSFMFALDLASILFGEFTASGSTGLLIRGLGVTCGVLTLLRAVAAQRRARGACSRCGRSPAAHPGSGRGGSAPWWAYAGAYGALAGAVVRLAAELVTGLPWSPTEPETVVFLILYAAAGSLLPLALAHRWGRIWPRWVLPLAGRHVPRWIVLVPAFLVGGGLAAYFGLVGGTYAILGDLGPAFPLWWILMVIPGYTVWGIGLLVAAVFYLGATKPPCPRTTWTGPGEG
ncbi:hypothetical protein K3N28_11575 [Glycomyces sp. TRM65418]|uniref:hypothetical protein n=1 Tax=Glycomyces sp. TRM65418 TaxID=2867006 RepID=UPI001CE6C5E8|nr:hypothetical protein [Glycomyces sp. TRM65418]MCC3763709.1 hypothetical protein [Glycomyces sp. TRM65418]QZD57687.1 hypothetical protein K3N28_11515 [Glycomyces sp. TRM65418]